MPLTYFAASFVYMALIVTFAIPAMNVLLRWFYMRRNSISRMAAQIEWLCPAVLKDAPGGIVEYNLYYPYFDARHRLVELMTYFGVLLTFGLVFPPLAVAMLVAISAAVATVKLQVGHFLTAAVVANRPFYLQLVDSECKGVASQRMLQTCALQLLFFTCFFYAPFLFDTLGDAVGNRRAAWVVGVVPLFIALSAAGNVLADKLASTESETASTKTKSAAQDSGATRQLEFEMRSSVVGLEEVEVEVEH